MLYVFIISILYIFCHTLHPHHFWFWNWAHDLCTNQYAGQTPPAPIRGAAVKKQAAGDGDEEEAAQEAEEVNVMDLIPRTDISGSITESLVSELNDKNWKVSGFDPLHMFYLRLGTCMKFLV